MSYDRKETMKPISVPLVNADFEENTITLKLPASEMAHGFNVGHVKIDLSDVQQGRFLAEIEEWG